MQVASVDGLAHMFPTAFDVQTGSATQVHFAVPAGPVQVCRVGQAFAAPH
jgi:hypothetical protein